MGYFSEDLPSGKNLIDSGTNKNQTFIKFSCYQDDW